MHAPVPVPVAVAVAGGGGLAATGAGSVGFQVYGCRLTVQYTAMHTPVHGHPGKHQHSPGPPSLYPALYSNHR